jgi:hypothetical protein
VDHREGSKRENHRQREDYKRVDHRKIEVPRGRTTDREKVPKD